MLMALIVAVAVVGDPQKSHVEINCEHVRAFVAQHGHKAAIALALAHGVGLRQLREAQKCLR